MQRRRLVGTIAAWLAWPVPSLAQQRRSLVDPMRLGVDRALFDSGLAPALQRGFGRDTGIAVKVIPGPAQALLQALERGELDAALTNAPQLEAQFETQGFVHERAVVASSEFILVGPLLKAATKVAKAKPRDPAGIVGAVDAAAALRTLRDAAGTDDTIRFLSANDGSGTHLAEQALWRSAQVAPQAPWYTNANGSESLTRRARQDGAYALVERGVWDAFGGAPLGVLITDPSLRLPVHFMRGFRNNHPAAKFFSKWITGPKGRAIVAAQRGYRVPSP